MATTKSPKAKSTIEITATSLRELVQSGEPDALLGSEEELIARLKVSRATLRQVARLLEREGWLTVKRGINGGYFSARPDLKTIENSINAYLDMIDADVKETAIIGTTLWIEILGRAASAEPQRAKTTVHMLRDKVLALRSRASLDDVLKIDLEIRAGFLKLIDSRYIEFLFQINVIYAGRKFVSRPPESEMTPEHYEFVQAWRQAKLMEFSAVEDGDKELAMLAARHSRNLWYRRWQSLELAMDL